MLTTLRKCVILSQYSTITTRRSQLAGKRSPIGVKWNYVNTSSVWLLMTKTTDCSFTLQFGICTARGAADACFQA